MRRRLLVGSASALAAVAALLLAMHVTGLPARAQAGRPGASVPAGSEAVVDAPFTFRHLVLSTARDAAEICFTFSAILDERAETRYGDYVSVSPSARPAFRASGRSLCLGGLAYGTAYTVTLKAGLPSAGGVRLARDETVPVSLGERPPLVDTSGDGFILPRAVGHGLTIQTVNVNRVRIHVLRMSDRLLPVSVGTHSGSGAVDLGSSGLEGYDISSLLQGSMSVIWTGTMAIQQDHNRTVLTAFPIGQVIRQGMLGAYLVVAEDDAHAVPEASWRAAGTGDYDSAFYRPHAARGSHWVIATDIALTTLSGTDGLHVMARSLASAAAAPGVTLDLLSVGQDVLARATTDAAGMVHFAPGLLRGRGASAPGVVTAHAEGGDFTLLNLSRPAFDFSDRGVTGRPSPAPLQAFLYTERGIYRPGQTVQLMALLRDRLGDAAHLPLTLVLHRPNGMEAARFSQPSQPPQPATGFHQGIRLSATAARGTWTVEALADPAGAAIGRVSFEVQDYVPQQLKVTLAPTPPALPAGSIPIDVRGDFLYGAPAAGLHGQADLVVMRDPDPVIGLSGWQFGLADETVDNKTQTVPLPDADAQGHSHADATLDLPPPTQSPLKVSITAGLFEPSGRIVTDSHEARLRTRPLLIGLHTRFADGRADTDREAAVEIRVFDGVGAPAARRSLSWRLVREQQVFDWFQQGSVWHWHYHTVDEELAQGSIDAAPTVPAAVTRRFDYGRYRLIVSDAATNTASSIRFSAGWQETAGQADIPDTLHVSVDRPTLAAGQTAHLRLDSPFAGHASLVVANDRVIETREMTVGKGANVLDVTQSATWGAGAYVLVSLYRPLAATDSGAHDPVRAVGVAWIATDAAPRILNVALQAPGRIRPQRDVVVPVHVGNLPPGARAYVTLAAVDEGILQLTRYQSPDPVGFLFGKRALGVSMRDDYGKLLDGSADPGQIQGGDEGVGGAGLPVVSTRTVALFSGPVALDASGEARIPLSIGDFAGALRLMAVAYTDTGVGQAQATMIVRDPVVADIAVPRFLGTGDTAALAVSLDDTDAPAGAYHLAVQVSGAAALAGPGAIDAQLVPGRRFAATIAMQARTEGVAGIAAHLTGPGGLTIDRTWQLAVRSAHAPVTLAQSAWQNSGETYAVDTGLLRPFVPGSTSVSLGYSGFGGLDVPSLLQSLGRYPFGCTEQLTSVAFPLVYFDDPSLRGALPGDRGVHDRVQDAIDTILDRQDENGEFGLWRAGDREASTWLGVYALDFLTHAKEAGFSVPDSALQRSALWLRHAADSDLPERAYKYYAQGATVTRAYADYVLARLGRADMGDMRRLQDTMRQGTGVDRNLWLAGEDVLEPLALGQVGGAFSLMGDRSRADEAFRMALDNLDAPVWPDWWFDWSYSTRLRDVAGLIAVAADTGRDRMLHTLLDRFAREGRSPASLNTQEQAALLSAAHALNKGVTTLDFEVNGRPQRTGSTPDFSPAPAEIASGYAVRNTSPRSLWRTLSVTGAPVEAAPALSAGYVIEKHFFSLAGQALDPARMRQNDRVVVELHGRVDDDGASHRTVIVDLLPAGWEIEAPVVDDTQYGFLGALSATRVREARDDRFVAALDFGSDLRGWRFVDDGDDAHRAKPHLDAREFRVAYVARAITPGHFTLPEAVAQDMYRPAFMARTEAATTDVVRPRP